jgi:1,4-dihydroxy-6-naphthoate synthase
MKITLGFSPCPNDTFIFDALVNHKIDTEGLDFEVVLEDVQTLNKWAIEGKLDFSKISYGVLPLVLQNYIVLNSGGALGKGVGPLLITNNKNIGSLNADPLLTNTIVAVPGVNTTAHMLFSLAFPQAKNKVFKVFNQIEDFVQQSPAENAAEVRLGVIIHENRFTYHLKGLHKLKDLGEYWEETTGLPIPLGGIIAKRSLDEALIKQVDRLIAKSVEYAYAHHHTQLAEYVKQHSQEMSEDVMRQHINLYVNNYSIGLGESGRHAVLKLLEVYSALNNTQPFLADNIFV